MHNDCMYFMLHGCIASFIRFKQERFQDILRFRTRIRVTQNALLCNHLLQDGLQITVRDPCPAHTINPLSVTVIHQTLRQ